MDECCFIDPSYVHGIVIGKAVKEWKIRDEPRILFHMQMDSWVRGHRDAANTKDPLRNPRASHRNGSGHGVEEKARF